MSYRELRNFTEIMRALGYPRLISLENFRKPNFELVADILYWMVKLYDPETTISDKVEFENERVDFLTGIASLMATTARLKLSTKKLYASDGRAVQELLKLAVLLNRIFYHASCSSRNLSLSKMTSEDNPPPQIKVQDVKAARLLASEITLKGARVYDLLANEATERQERARAIQFLDKTTSAADGSREQAYVERSIKELIDSSKQAVEDLRKECEELEADERNIDSKIKKKQEELDRTEKRLKSLENVRPQFMDEIEKLEKELQVHYNIYMEKYRNLDYLEHESEKYRKNEEERMEEQDRRLKKTRERLLRDEVDLMRGGDDEPVEKESRSKGVAGITGRDSNGLTGVMGKVMGKSRDSSEAEDNLTDSVGGNDSSEEDRSVSSGKKRGGSKAKKGPAPGVRKPPQREVSGVTDRRVKGRGAGNSDADSDDFVDDDDDDDEDDENADGDDSGSDDDF